MPLRLSRRRVAFLTMIAVVLVLLCVGGRTAWKRMQTQVLIEYLDAHEVGYEAKPLRPWWASKWFPSAYDDVFLNVHHIERGKVVPGSLLPSLMWQSGLEYIAIDRGFTDRELRGLARFPRLRGLSVGDSNTSAIIPDLKSFVNISGLSLSGDWLNEAAFRQLPSFPNVKSLSISARHWNGRGLAFAEKFPQIRILYLECDELPSDTIMNLAQMPSLESLLFYEMRVAPADLLPLKDAPHLTYLNLHKTREITDEDLATLSQLGGLRRLDLKHKNFVYPFSVYKALTNNMPLCEINPWDGFPDDVYPVRSESQ